MSNYTLEAMYEAQKAFDGRIVTEKGLAGQNLLAKKVLALQVEIAELANEWRGFKMWSNDQEMRREKALEEFADCFSFFLSIANELNLPAEDLYTYDELLEGETEEIFIELIHGVGVLINKDDDHEKKRMFFRMSHFVFQNLGDKRLGFDFDEIAEAYYAKNKINHDRQANGY